MSKVKIEVKCKRNLTLKIQDFFRNHPEVGWFASTRMTRARETGSQTKTPAHFKKFGNF